MADGLPLPSGPEQKVLSFGPYPAVLLAAARARRAEAKAALARGIDPITVKPGAELPSEVPKERMFETVAWAWFEAVAPGYKPVVRAQVRSMLTRLIVPPLARLDVARITLKPEVLAMLRTDRGLENGTADAAPRQAVCHPHLRARAEDDGLCQSNPAALYPTRQSQAPSLPAVKRPRVAQEAIPTLLMDISGYHDRAATAWPTAGAPHGPAIERGPSRPAGMRSAPTFGVWAATG